MTWTASKGIPIFRSFDERLARRFYVDYLGFSWDGEHRFDAAAPLYAFLSLGDFTLHLSEHYGDCTPGATAIVPMSGIQDYLEKMRARGHPNANPAVETLPWGQQIQVSDPFGNRLRFLQESGS
ncbi:MAG: glyoxalase superfamily protein [Pseudomonadota bacterium]